MSYQSPLNLLPTAPNGQHFQYFTCLRLHFSVVAVYFPRNPELNNKRELEIDIEVTIDDITVNSTTQVRWIPPSVKPCGWNSTNLFVLF